MIFCVPFVECLRSALICCMHPRDGLAYVLASIVHASIDVLALTTKEIIVGDKEPMIAFKMS